MPSANSDARINFRLKGLPRLDVPVVLLGRLAVDRSVQGQGLGALLLVYAVRRSLQVSDQVGVRAVEVDARDEPARKFYLKFGFRPLLEDRRHLFLPLHEIRKLRLDLHDASVNFACSTEQASRRVNSSGRAANLAGSI